MLGQSQPRRGLVGGPVLGLSAANRGRAVTNTAEHLLKRCLPSPIRRLGRGLLCKFVDSHLVPWNCPPRSLLRQTAWTLCYRAAGVGVALTANERRLLSFRNRHRGQRAFILGNGPSLNECDLTRLKNEVTFGVNGIFLNYDRMGFHPTYYVVEDVFVAEDLMEIELPLPR